MNFEHVSQKVGYSKSKKIRMVLLVFIVGKWHIIMGYPVRGEIR